MATVSQPATTFHMRRACESDLPQAAALGSTLLREFERRDPGRFPLLNDPPEPNFEAFLARCRLDPQWVVLVAEMDGAIVGYALGSLEPVNWKILAREHGMIQDLIVAPEARGRGVGEALLKRMMRELRALGAERILLQTPVDNECARRLYEKLGFRPTLIEYYQGPEDISNEVPVQE
jgi:ribosomal protein S18 acetylase RimI-like enzyme